jgi:predicted alpha/beta-fold hydrolase
LRLNLRGADRSGQGIYHAGLCSDVLAALRSPAISAYARRFVIGFSMGGHVALRAVAEQPGAVDGLVTICAPLDLAASCRHIDHPYRSLYRWHVLNGLKEIYSAYAARHSQAVDPRITGCRRLYDWDERVVAPHFGFAGADDYYARMSARPLLPTISCRTLVIAAQRDPMVPEHVLRPHLRHVSSAVTVSWVEGGHVGFPPREKIWSRILRWLQT